MNLGLLAGFSQGLKDGLLSYRDAKKYNDEKELQEKRIAQEVEDRRLRREDILADRDYRNKRDEREVQQYQDKLLQQKIENEREEKKFLQKDREIDITKSLKEAQAKRLGLLAARGSAGSSFGLLGGGKILPADKVLRVQDGKNVPRLLSDISETLESNQDLLGPFRGRLGSANPYDERAQTIDSQLRSASQMFGRYLEGGVLRKEDEEKYRKMFPQLSDTPEVAKNKLQIVERLLNQKLQDDTHALKASGYDTRGLEGELPVPDAPAVLQSKKNPIREAGAKSSPQALTGQDLQALQWAQANANDPRAREIMKRLGR